MGGGELQVERAELRSKATGFGDGAQALGRALLTLSSALTAEGNCWGNDDTGKAFASKYTQPRDDALKAFSSLQKSLDGIEKNVRTMADNYDGAEKASGG